MRIAIVLLLGCFIACSLSQTTLNFPEIFLGKCFEKNPSGTDCYGLLSNFSYAAMTDNSKQNDTLYDPFFAMANFSTPKSSILFWSGNMAFALAISTNDPRFVTVEETSTGFILNGMNWCGTPSHTFNYVSPCYYPSNSTYYGTSGVWTRASRAFAGGASGDIYILLEPASIGGTPPIYLAFRNGSIFGSVELDAMNVSKVDSITVLLLKNTTRAPEEKCGGGSLLILGDRIKAKFGYSMKCVDDPTTIYSMLCPQHTSSAQCLAATLVYNYEIKKKADDHLIWAIITTVIAGVFFILSLFLLARVATLRNKGYENVTLLPPDDPHFYSQTER